MYKRITVIALSLVLLFNFSAKADEGMWLLSLLGKNYSEMKAKGLKLTPDDIYNVNHGSLKDAVIGLGNEQYPFGFFCTGEIISDQGLVLTNHHCGYEQIQAHSTVDHDYLTNGFWALSKDQELKAEGMVISRLVRMEDVTAKVLAKIGENATEEERASAIASISKELIKEAKEDNNYGADVKSMFEGNQFFLFVYETFRDIRLVGAPPSSIGKFGGDTDNWMWPRHTGDFSMFRIYANKDNKPAAFSKDNVPYKPVHHLPVSLKGVKKDDFAMVLGFPGSTDRYLTSFGVKEALDISNPTTVAIRTVKLEKMKEDMNKSDKIRIQYAAKYAQTANYWKYFQGQSRGLKKNNIYEKKKQLENNFTTWLNADNERKEKYGEALNYISKFYKENEKQAQAYTYMYEGLLQGGEIVMFPTRVMRLAGVLKNSPDNKELIKKMAEEIREGSGDYWKDYNVGTDKKIFTALMEMYFENVPLEYRLPEKPVDTAKTKESKAAYKDGMKKYNKNIFVLIENKYKQDMAKFADMVYSNSIFADSIKFNKFLDNPTSKVLEADYGYKLMNGTIQKYFALGGGKTQEFHKGKRLLEAGLMEMQKNKVFYPDANSTMRLTYGQVGDYKPRDAVFYDYFTTIEGIMEKEDPKNPEFVVDAKLKELYKKKDYGRFADKNGQLRVCFTTNNDITGGNSGSPVINGKGELIGTAFDGNWEAMSGDIVFEKVLQKCINVDVRYTLFVIEKVGGAKNLVDEMTLVK